VGQQVRVTSDVVRASSPRGRVRAAAATGGARSIKPPAPKAVKAAPARRPPGGAAIPPR
jgi:hypothetical protein